MNSHPPLDPQQFGGYRSAIERHYYRYAALEGRIHTITIQGKVLTWDIAREAYARPPEKKKGTVTGFSAAARLRMFRLLGRIDYSKIRPAYFITLTYPDHALPKGKDQCNRQRYLFWRDLEKYLAGQTQGVWRLEWIGRKTGDWVGFACPHIHLVLFSGRLLDVETVRDAWMRSINEDAWTSVDCQMMTTEKQLGCYVAKYCAKADCLLDVGLNLNKMWSGKFWGCHRRNRMPFGGSEEWRLVTTDLLEACYAYALEGRDIRYADRNKSITILGAKAVELGELIQHAAIDASMDGQYLDDI